MHFVITLEVVVRRLLLCRTSVHRKTVLCKQSLRHILKLLCYFRRLSDERAAASSEQIAFLQAQQAELSELLAVAQVGSCRGKCSANIDPLSESRRIDTLTSSHAASFFTGGHKCECQKESDSVEEQRAGSMSKERTACRWMFLLVPCHFYTGMHDRNKY